MKKAYFNKNTGELQGYGIDETQEIAISDNYYIIEYKDENEIKNKYIDSNLNLIDNIKFLIQKIGNTVKISHDTYNGDLTIIYDDGISPLTEIVKFSNNYTVNKIDEYVEITISGTNCISIKIIEIRIL